MKRIAILGGGISGLTAAYELEQQRRAGKPVDWHLYEALDRLGGIVQTTRIATPEGEYVLEGGPDAWVTEKPWARELAEELGLGPEIVFSNDTIRKTWIVIDGVLRPIPGGMRLMVPTDLSALDDSELFSADAKRAFLDELRRFAELKAAIPAADESVASFVRRHFGQEVLTKLGAPLLSGVFGGDVEKLSVRAVMPAFVAMERSHGSLIAAVQQHSRAKAAPQPIFSSLRRGMGSLIEALTAALPADRLHLGQRAVSLLRTQAGWTAMIEAGSHAPSAPTVEGFAHLVVALPLEQTRRLLTEAVPEAPGLLPSEASSAVLACLNWPARTASGRPLPQITVPEGFGFLNPRHKISPDDAGGDPTPQLLAATFVDRKFPHRAPPDSRIIRVFFGSDGAEALVSAPDSEVAQAALQELRRIIGPLPDPEASLTTVQRWPRSLPQYEVGHLDRLDQLKQLISRVPGLHLLGNSYHGVGVPDLIRDARACARAVVSTG